jgi:hypothetical protein
MLISFIPIVIIVFFISFCIWFSIKVRRSNADYLKEDEDYIGEEMEANFARTRDIEEERFFRPDGRLTERVREKYPDDKALEPLIAAAEKHSQRKMIQFEKVMTNREIKLMYGLSNLEPIIQYEENFVNYIRALITLGEKAGDAELLEDTARMGSVFPKNYTLLADMYAINGDKSKLRDLKLILMQNKGLFTDEQSYNKCNGYINAKMEGTA